MQIDARISAMADEKQVRDVHQASPLQVLLAFTAPPLTAVFIWTLFTSFSTAEAVSAQGISAVILGSLGVASLALGLHWYGSSGLGLRGARPLTAGIGFAVLGWIAFLALRFIFVAIMALGSTSGTRAYIYLLLFEAFATQLWTFGLLFRVIADWRGALVAAIGSGIVFGLVAVLYFQEAYVINGLSIIYFIAWGILYGIIRLRTGSLLGPMLVQSVHTFTAWVVLRPYPNPNIGELNNLYVAATIAYMVIIWRLWPKTKSDYRV
jgi:membrane protease YdiL (CAAX protease family)